MTHCGKNEIILKDLPSNTYDSCVTDAPYGLGEEPDPVKMVKAWIEEGFMPLKGKGFMGKEWDAFVPQPNFWKEIYRVLKPGAFVVCFFGTRTYDWGVLAMRLAGFEIKDQLAWIYGEGFPKGINIGKQDGGEAFKGWQTGLKPAYEPIVLARKPISESTIVKNMIKHGVGAYNIGASRIGNEQRFNEHTGKDGSSFVQKQNEEWEGEDVIGRYPSNILLGHHPDCKFVGVEIIKEGVENVKTNLEKSTSEIDVVTPIKSGMHYGQEAIEVYDCHCDCPIKMLNEQSGILTSGKPAGNKAGNNNQVFGNFNGGIPVSGYGGSGGAARFFYCAKASGDEREIGVKSWEKKPAGNNLSGGTENRLDGGKVPKRANHHPTVKPVEVMRYLVKLVTPKGGKIIEPFGGSGTTGVAAKMEFMECDIIEQDAYWCKIIDARVAAWKPQYGLDSLFGG